MSIHKVKQQGLAPECYTLTEARTSTKPPLQRVSSAKRVPAGAGRQPGPRVRLGLPRRTTTTRAPDPRSGLLQVQKHAHHTREDAKETAGKGDSQAVAGTAEVNRTRGNNGQKGHQESEDGDTAVS